VIGCGLGFRVFDFGFVLGLFMWVLGFLLCLLVFCEVVFVIWGG